MSGQAQARRVKRTSRRLCLLVVLGCAGPILAAAEPSVAESRDARAQADAAAALDRANDRLATVPGDPQTRFIKASALAELGRLNDAIVVLEQLSADYPERADIANNLGVLLARAGRLAAAREQLTAAVGQAQPDTEEGASIQRNLGDVYLALADQAYAHAGASAAPRRRGLQQLLPALAQMGEPPASHQAHNSEDAELEATARAVLARRARGRAAGDLDTVLSTYSADYQPPGTQSRAAWLTELRSGLKAGERQTAPDIVGLTVQAEGGGRLQARYRLSSDAPASREHQATLVAEDGQWRIVSGG